MNLERKIKRNQEKEKLKNIKNTYNKKPKEKCPICKKYSLFMNTKDGKIYCIRCNNCIKTN